MKIRIHFCIIGLILIIGFVVGSFLDLQINQALFSNRNGFGIAVSAFGLLIGYGFLSFFAGLFFRTTLSSSYKSWVKIIFYLLSFGGLIAAIFFSQKEIFSINGLNKSGTLYTVVAWLIALVVEGAIFFTTFKLSKNYKNDRFWIVALILYLIVIISLVAGTTLLKSVFHRPRYRTVQLGIEGLTYHNWWQPFKEYKNFITGTITKEEFKSFPSGHAGTSFLAISFAVFLPLVFSIKKRTQIIIFYTAVLYALVVCFSRMLVGAHFLSDVSMGAALTWLCTYIAYEIITRNKLLVIEKQYE